MRKDETEYTNLSALGEFVLGYQNEYGHFTERPLLDPVAGVDLPAALDAPQKLDLGRHGTYFVIRELRQDVRGFWQYLRAQAGSAVEASRLAEAMMGRTMNGEPLVQCGGRSIQGIARTPENDRLNHFLFADDPNGERCPLGAHIRRANPRNSDFGGPVGRTDVSPHAQPRVRRQGVARRSRRLDALSSHSPPRPEVRSQL